MQLHRVLSIPIIKALNSNTEIFVMALYVLPTDTLVQIATTALEGSTNNARMK